MKKLRFGVNSNYPKVSQIAGGSRVWGIHSPYSILCGQNQMRQIKGRQKRKWGVWFENDGVTQISTGNQVSWSLIHWEVIFVTHMDISSSQQFSKTVNTQIEMYWQRGTTSHAYSKLKPSCGTCFVWHLSHLHIDGKGKRKSLVGLQKSVKKQKERFRKQRKRKGRKGKEKRFQRSQHQFRPRVPLILCPSQ